MKTSQIAPWLCAATLAVSAPWAHAVSFNDAVGDYVPGFTGSRAGDLDVVSSIVTYNVAKNTFVFSGTMNADIGTTPGGFYVFGINRGFGTAGFAANGFGGVLFDSVVIFNADGSGRVTATNNTFGAGFAKVIGSTIIGEIPGDWLPTVAGGFAKTAYTWNLWPRDGALAGFAAISDFAPDNTNLGVTVIGAVPEPGSLAMLVGGLGLIALRRRVNSVSSSSRRA